MWKREALYFLLVVISTQHVSAQDCLTPTVPNGNFVGDLTEGGNAAILCLSGYTGGGQATCSGGVWIVLPSCSPRDCGTTTVANGVLLGDTFYGGTAAVICNAGYEGGGPATCGATGTWTSVPGCTTAVDCGTTTVANGVFLGDTFYGGTAFVNCSAGYEGGGQATCGVAGSWTSLPGCTAVDCGPPSVNHGSNVGDTTYGGSPFIQCDTGYTGGGTGLTCLETGEWDIQTLCNPRNCGIPTTAHGSLTSTSSTLYGGSATVECDPGYTGGGSVTCLDNGNWTTLPACNPVDCGTTTVANGVLLGDTFYGGTAFVNCSAGYEGGGQATCWVAGSWTSLPGCTAVDCGPPSVNHGSIAGDTTYGGSPFIQCDTGYTGGGTGLTCLETREWDIQTLCNPRSCGTPTVSNGALNGDTFYTGVAAITCDAGYDGGGTAICLSTGQWATLPTCSLKDCGTPTTAHGSLSSTSSTLYGGSATVECDPGYTGGGSVTCLDNGNWTTLPTCYPVDCGIPTTVHGALSSTSSTFYGGSATVECDSGYTGGGSVACLYTGNWGNIPACNSVGCGTPTVANGALNGDTFYTGVAAVTCDAGYDGGGTATCLSTGQWATLPTCSLKECGTPTTAHGSLSSTSSTLYGGSATVECDPGYTGGGSVTCLDNGNWTTLPTCYPVDCGIPTTVHGALSSTSSTLYGGSATVECDSGYTGGGSVACLYTGNWGNIPACNSVGCPDPLPPVHGYVDVSNGRAFGNTITYSCEIGYRLIGQVSRKCRDDSTWSGNDPLCYIECPVLSGIKDGQVDLSAGYWESSIATYICDKDYALVGIPSRTCQNTGQWNGIEPTCIIAIFPDILFVVAGLLILIVIVDMLVVAFCIYLRYDRKKRKNQNPMSNDSDDDLKSKDEEGYFREKENGMLPSLKSRAFKQQLNLVHKHDEAYESPVKKVTVRKQENTKGAIPKPAPLPKVSHKDTFVPKVYESEPIRFKNEIIPFVALETSVPPPNTLQQPVTNVVPTEKIADVEKLLDDDGSEISDKNHEQATNEDNISINKLTNPLFDTGDNMIVMDYDAHENKNPHTKFEETQETFKGRIQLPRGLDKSSGLDNEGEQRHVSKEARKHMKTTMSAYSSALAKPARKSKT